MSFLLRFRLFAKSINNPGDKDATIPTTSVLSPAFANLISSPENKEEILLTSSATQPPAADNDIIPEVKNVILLGSPAPLVASTHQSGTSEN